MSDTSEDKGEAERGQKPEEGQSPPKKGRGRRFLLLGGLAALFILCGAAYGAYWYLVAQYWVTTADAYIQGNMVTLMPQISGTVTTIHTENTQLVKEGEPLIDLDRTDRRVALDQAEAGLAQTVRSVRQIFDQADQLRATVRLREAQLEQNKLDLDRDQALVSRNNISRSQFQHTRTTWDAGQASLNAAQHQLDATLAAIDNTTLADHPQVKSAETRLRQAFIDLNRTTIRAPVTGYIANRTVQVGQEVSPGMALLAVVPLDQIWIDANYKETALGSMRLGQPVSINADFYGSGVDFHGHVAGLSPGTGSAFQLLPPENATGNWIKIVRRVPVRIELEPEELAQNPLRIGLSTEVSVDIHNEGGRKLDRTIQPKPIYQTPIFARQNDGVEALIQKIVRANAGTGTGPGAKEVATDPPAVVDGVATDGR